MLHRHRSLSLIWIVVALLSSAAALAQAAPPVPLSTSGTASADPGEQSASPQESSSLLVTQSSPTPQVHAPANGPVTVLENTVIRVITDTPMSSRMTHAGARLRFTVSEDVVVDHVRVIPRGATVYGTAVQAKGSGALAGSPELTLRLTSLELGGKTYPLYTYLFRVQGMSKTGPTETKIKGGAVIGAIVGGAFSGSAKGGSTAVGRAAGMGTGAALGAGIGTAVAAATPGPLLSIPAESQIDFSLAFPIAVQPVSAKEAARLGQGLSHGGPVLYVRGDTP